MHVLFSDEPSPHLPVCEIYPSRSLHLTLHEFMIVSYWCGAIFFTKITSKLERIFQEILGKNVAQHRPHGLLSVEFGGRIGFDGLCLTVLVSFKPFLEEVSSVGGKYSWHEPSMGLADAIVPRFPRNMTVCLSVIR